MLNGVTQQFYGRDGKRYADPVAIEMVLQRACLFICHDHPSLQLCLPKIGCGLGGLDWSTEIEPLVIEITEFYGIIPSVYEI